MPAARGATNEGGEALVAERVETEIEALQRGQPPQGRREGHQLRVTDGGVAQTKGLKPRQGALALLAQGGGERRGTLCVAHMHVAEIIQGRSRPAARPL